MGCNESREKELPPVHFTFSLPTPLPLHLYHYATQRSPTSVSPTSSQPFIPTLPTSLSPTSLSPTSLSPTSLSPTSLSPTSTSATTAKASPTRKASPIIKNMATSHHSKLKAIAHYKFPTFKKFPPRVQEQIFNHIEKELQGK